MRKAFYLAVSGALASPATAADLAVNIAIPRLEVAEYHRPYVAVWIETPDQSVAANLAVWYDLKMRNGEGTKWLKDLRQWWRRSGRELSMPVDGLSGATRAPGEHQITFSSASAPLNSLPAGEYRLVVEAVREVGGRELVRIPFQWPPAKPSGQEVSGRDELGRVALSLAP